MTTNVTNVVQALTKLHDDMRVRANASSDPLDTARAYAKGCAVGITSALAILARATEFIEREYHRMHAEVEPDVASGLNRAHEALTGRRLSPAVPEVAVAAVLR